MSGKFDYEQYWHDLPVDPVEPVVRSKSAKPPGTDEPPIWLKQDVASTPRNLEDSVADGFATFNTQPVRRSSKGTRGPLSSRAASLSYAMWKEPEGRDNRETDASAQGHSQPITRPARARSTQGRSGTFLVGALLSICLFYAWSNGTFTQLSPTQATAAAVKKWYASNSDDIRKLRDDMLKIANAAALHSESRMFSACLDLHTSATVAQVAPAIPHSDTNRYYQSALRHALAAADYCATAIQRQSAATMRLATTEIELCTADLDRANAALDRLRT